MVEVRVDKLLEGHGRSLYRLAKETGVSHTTLWRLKKGKALGISFNTLERVCRGPNCQCGDITLVFLELTVSRQTLSRSVQEDKQKPPPKKDPMKAVVKVKRDPPKNNKKSKRQ